MQKRADHADQSVLFFLAGANFWEKHAKKLCYFVYFLVLIFLGGKLVGANFYAFCDYDFRMVRNMKETGQLVRAAMGYATGNSDTLSHISQMSLDPPFKTPLSCVFMKLQNLASGECQL